MSWGSCNKDPEVDSLQDSLAAVPEADARDAGVGRQGGVPPRPLSSCVDGRALPGSSRGRPSVRVCVLMSSSCNDPSHTGSGPPW